MTRTSVIRSGLLSFVCILSPGALRADTMYSFSGTYGTYHVSISFDTSLTGTALDNLSTDDITSTVSNFMETNTIPSTGSAALDVVNSTDSLGNITSFSITDLLDQVVTNTSDTVPGTPTTYSAPSTDTAGHAQMFTNVQSGTLFGYYGYGIGYCTWDDNSGLPSNNPPSTDPNCLATAVSHPGTPSLSATGSGAWSPLNPGRSGHGTGGQQRHDAGHRTVARPGTGDGSPQTAHLFFKVSHLANATFCSYS